MRKKTKGGSSWTG